MYKKLHNHIGYSISLFLILVFGLILVSLSSPNRPLQMIEITIVTTFYIFWGILHHLVNHDLNVKIVIEYILVGSIGLSMVLFILKGGFGL